MSREILMVAMALGGALLTAAVVVLLVWLVRRQFR